MSQTITKNNLENINNNLKKLNDMTDKLTKDFKYKNNVISQSIKQNDYHKKNFNNDK